MRSGLLCLKCENFACLHTRQDQNELHLKIGFFFFFAKIAIFWKSTVGPFSKALFKLIICQIRHKLSVTIHDISTSWKKVRWRTQHPITCYRNFPLHSCVIRRWLLNRFWRFALLWRLYIMMFYWAFSIMQRPIRIIQLCFWTKICSKWWFVLSESSFQFFWVRIFCAPNAKILLVYI